MATILQADQTLPPGTQRIETSTGTEIVLSPIPSPDPNQPLNWPKWRKALHMTLLCLYCVLVFATLTVATPLWVNINAETGISFDALNDAYAAGSAALAVGCLFFVPMGLKFGRRPVYIATSLLMTASAIWQGRSQNTANFIVSNTIAGFAGAANEALFQVTVSDLFFVHQRASINGIYLAAVCLGNYLGPVAAGYVAVAQDWRWVFYYLTIFLAVTSIALIFLLEESKFPSPVFNGHSTGIAKANTQPHDSNNSGEKVDFKSAAHGPDSRLSIQATRESVLDRSSIPIHSYWKRHRLYTLDPESSRNKQNSFLRHVFQPFELLCRFPAVAFVALQYGWLISMLSIVAVTQATLLPAPPYNFSAAAVGLMSLPPAIGAFLGSMVGGPLVDVLAVQVAKRRAGIHEPETRLWFYMVPGCGLIIGALLYGLSIAKVREIPSNTNIHPITPVLTVSLGRSMDHQRHRSRLRRFCPRRLRRHVTHIPPRLIPIRTFHRNHHHPHLSYSLNQYTYLSF